MRTRIIVKPVHFEGLRKIGTPTEEASFCYVGIL